jgi:DNA polymerase-1
MVPAMTNDSSQLKPGDHLFLVDGSNFIFRAYFQSINQDRKYNARSDGLPSGAVRLFATKLFQFVREGVLGVKPTHLAIVFDKSENSFRKEIYPAYKGNRSDPPPDLIPQFPLMRDAVRAFGLIPVEQDIYEADDLIATYARQAREAGADVLIVSADKDLMQLVQPGVAMYDPASGDAKKGAGFRPERRISEPEVVEYFGVTPDKVTDVQALAGDSTDNVPGAPGIGIKTAAQLIGEYGDLDTLLARAGEIKQPKRRETLTNPEVVEKVRISHKLVTLVDDVKVETPIGELTLNQPDPAKLIAFLKAMEFTTITKRAAEAYEADVGAIDADPDLAPGGARAAALKALYAETDLPVVGAVAATEGETTVAAVVEGKPAPAADGWLRPADLAAARKDAALAVKIDHATYECVRSIADLSRWIGWAYEAGQVALDTETNSLDVMQADLIGISLAVAPGKACYIPLQHRAGDGLFDSGLLEGQIPLDQALAELKPLLADPGVLKIGQNLKYDIAVFNRHGVEVGPIDDTMLISYALDAGHGGQGMDRLSEIHLGHKPIAYSEVAGTGKSQVTFDKVPLDKATAYAAEDADVTLRLWLALKPRLVPERKTTVYETMERPLVPVLVRMERRGIAIDRQILSRLSGEFAQSLARLEDEIHTLAGEKFTIGSPKQLGDILFGKMGLPGAKKTATGQWATGAGVLEDLAEQGNELPARILDWRQLAKLKSTYTDALPPYDQPANRPRPYLLCAGGDERRGVSASSDPNLQNIPIRTEEGRKIRTAFVAEKGHKIISADYSAKSNCASWRTSPISAQLKEGLRRTASTSMR